MKRRRRGIHVGATCRFRDEDGVRCTATIPAGHRLCEPHREESQAVKNARRRWHAEEASARRRDLELEAYRRRLDPGPLPLEG